MAPEGLEDPVHIPLRSQHQPIPKIPVKPFEPVTLSLPPADYVAYMIAKAKAAPGGATRKPEAGSHASILCAAGMGKFFTDGSIRDYCMRMASHAGAGKLRLQTINARNGRPPLSGCKRRTPAPI
jgi:hypothetical protein